MQLIIPSVSLMSSFKQCSQHREEALHFLVGFKLGKVGIATHSFWPGYNARSVVHAVADQRTTHKAFIAIREAGFYILGLIHIHPGEGLYANLPSGTDLQTQREYEQYSQVIGGIWSRDGLIRFFSVNHDFRVKVVGNHVQEVQCERSRQRIFKLTQFSLLSAPSEIEKHSGSVKEKKVEV